MRRPRLKAPEGFESAIYHCVSRVVDRQFVLGEGEREQFVRYMRLYERLYGLRVITFCIMSNHFHILVEVPMRPEILPSNESLIDLIGQTHGEGAAANLRNWIGLWSEQGNEAAIEEERERWFGQMWDVSAFMKVLKQRFSQWFNGRGGSAHSQSAGSNNRNGNGSVVVRRRGTLWEERFRSVLVESGAALQTMAAYIDLNPVRAGVVEDSKDYRWCGYGEACAGGNMARAGLNRAAQVTGGARGVSDRQGHESGEIFDVLAWYREEMYGRGEERRNEEGSVMRPGFSEAEVAAVREDKGRLPRHEYLRLRVRYFSDGAILGSKEFVESIFQARRKWFSATRRSGPRRLKGLDFRSPLRTARALVVDPVGPPTN